MLFATLVLTDKSTLHWQNFPATFSTSSTAETGRRAETTLAICAIFPPQCVSQGWVRGPMNLVAPEKPDIWEWKSNIFLTKQQAELNELSETVRFYLLFICLLNCSDYWLYCIIFFNFFFTIFARAYWPCVQVATVPAKLPYSRVRSQQELSIS